MVRKSAYDHAIAEIHSESRTEETIRLMELAALVELGLGHPLDARTFNEVAAAQADLRLSQEQLEAQLDAGLISPEGYLGELNNALTTWARRCTDVLGARRFAAIFGEAGQHPEDMTVPKICPRCGLPLLLCAAVSEACQPPIERVLRCAGLEGRQSEC